MQNTCAQTSLEKEELKRRRKNRDRSRTRRNVIQHFSRPFSKFCFIFISSRKSYRLPSRTRPSSTPLHHDLLRFRLPLTPVSLLFPALAFFLSLTLISHSIRRSRSVVTPLRLYKFYIIFMRHKVVEKPTKGGEKEERAEEFPYVQACSSVSFLSLPSPTGSHVAGRSGFQPPRARQPRLG